MVIKGRVIGIGDMSLFLFFLPCHSHFLLSSSVSLSSDLLDLLPFCLPFSAKWLKMTDEGLCAINPFSGEFLKYTLPSLHLDQSTVAKRVTVVNQRQNGKQ